MINLFLRVATQWGSRVRHPHIHKNISIYLLFLDVSTGSKLHLMHTDNPAESRRLPNTYLAPSYQSLLTYCWSPALASSFKLWAFCESLRRGAVDKKLIESHHGIPLWQISDGNWENDCSSGSNRDGNGAFLMQVRVREWEMCDEGALGSLSVAPPDRNKANKLKISCYFVVVLA